MLLVLALVMLGATNAVGQKIYRAELDKSMFKAWDGCGVDAKEVADPQPIDVTEEKPEGTKFSCDFNLYKEIGSWSGIYGSTAAYYLWYADLTGTKKMYFTGTPGFKFYVQFNREAPTEGGDSHGGNMVQQELTIAEDGTATYDIPETMTYVHLNCIKTKGIQGTGVLKGIEIEGTVKPVTGILSMINNGDAEGDDLTSFPVSYDGPNNGDSAPDSPVIVEGEGVNGSKCFKVTSFPDPTETWHSQFYIKADEVMPNGTKWKLTMSVKASNPCKITTSAQAQPRQWRGGFIDAFEVSDEWQEFTWTGEINVDQNDFQSIAFDLNNGADGPGNGGCDFYFDNIEFGVDLGGANPMSNVTPERGNWVVRVDFAGLTNMKNLVEANGITAEFPDESGDNMVKTKTLVFDNNCFDITWNGKKPTITSVEGRLDGNLYVFLADMDGEGSDAFNDENAVVKIAFKNPADEKHHLTFISGKWEGEAVPDFSGIDCPLQESLTTVTYYSYLLAAPEMVSVEPENGSFNLPADLKEIEVTFTQPVDVTTVVATLGGEALTVAPSEGFADIVTLTRTGDAALAGVKQLVIAAGVANAQGSPTTEDITVKYSFGESQIGEDDQVKVVYEANFTQSGDNANGAGWIVNADNNAGNQPAGSGAGARLVHGQAAFVADGLYLCARSSNLGFALYGTEADYKLALEPKTYHLTLDACQWDGDNRSLRVQVVPEGAVNTTDGTLVDGAEIIAEQFKEITKTKDSKEADHFDLAVTPTEAGNYVIRLTVGNKAGTPGGWGDGNLIGNIKVEYIPDVMGLVEMKAMATALENAKKVRDDNGDKGLERYAGAAYTTLDNLITEYDGKVMTSPTAYTEGANKLDEAAKALKDHRTACDTYDALPKQAQDLVIANANKKFAVMDEYTTLKTIAAKYIESENVVEGETVYTFKVLTDDAELAAAITELQDITKLAKGMFTEGASSMTKTGVAAVIERLRLGAEGLKALGVAADDPLIVAANEALKDDDALAEQIKTRTKTELYTKLKDGENIFETTKMEEVANPDYNPEDPEGMAAAEIPATIEQPVDVPVTYDMSVFVKNPNMYGLAKSKEVPGWKNISGNAGAWSSWDGAVNHSENTPYPEDCALHPGWHSVATVEQTITDLPVGIYTIKVRASNNGNLDATSTDNIVYAKLSDTPAVAEGEDLDVDVNYAAYVTFNTGSWDRVLTKKVKDNDENITESQDILVTDGVLTIGCTWGSLAQAFFDQVNLYITAPMGGFNYADAIPTAIETLEGTPAAKVRAIEMFDLNGRRVTKATKGLVIMKQIMSDGTVRTRKVVK